MKKLLFGILVLTALFTIGYSQSITVNVPAAGDVLDQDDPLVIRWSTGGILPSPLVKIRLWNSTETSRIFDIANNVEASAERFSCEAGLLSSVPDGSYVIIVRTLVGGIIGKSGIFTFGDPGSEPEPEPEPERGEKSIIVNPFPSSGLASGNTIKILWRARNLTNPQTITLWKNGTLFGTVESGLASGRISTFWEVGRTTIKTALPDSGFKIRVEEQGTGVFGESNTFPIVEKKNIDLSCYIAKANATRIKRAVFVTVKVRCNNFPGVINDVPVKIMIKKKSDGSLCSETTKIIPVVSYRGHSYEYEVKAKLSYCRFTGLLSNKFEAVAIVDPDDIFRDRSRRNNKAKKDVKY